MDYGPGKSVELWKAYFPNIKLSIMEYNKECAEKFRSKVDNLFIGDQSNPYILNSVGKEAGPFDIIVDDGGHTRKQQLISLLELWKYVKPNGGIYVLEDTFAALLSVYNDYDKSPYDFVGDNMKLFFDPSYTGQKSLVDIPNNKDLLDFHSSLMSMDCYREACVFVKK